MAQIMCMIWRHVVKYIHIWFSGRAEFWKTRDLENMGNPVISAELSAPFLTFPSDRHPFYKEKVIANGKSSKF